MSCSKKCNFLFHNLMLMCVANECLRRVFPCFNRKTKMKKKQGFSASFIMRNIQQIVRDFGRWHISIIEIGQLHDFSMTASSGP